MQRLLLMRHAEAQPGPDQTEGQLFSTGDEPLSEHGRKQARGMGEAIAASGLDVDTVHASPALRSRETAEIVAKQLPGDHHVSEHQDLLEVPYHGGEASYEEVLATIVETARRLREDPDPPLPTGASWQQVTGRFAQAIDTILADAGNPLVVAHGAQNRAWLVNLLGMPAHRLFFLEQDHACLNVVTYGDRHPVLQKLNLTPDRLTTEDASLADG